MMPPNPRVRRCPECSFEFALSESRCIHCGRPSFFPKVDAAAVPEERTTLQARYATEEGAGASLDTASLLAKLELAAKSTRAVIARPLREVERLAGNEREIYATNFQLIEGNTRQPDTGRWDRLRRVVPLCHKQALGPRAACVRAGAATERYGR